MSQLIEQIRHEQQTGDDSSLKKIIKKNLRNFASLRLDEKNSLLNAMCNVGDKNLIIRYIGHEQTDEEVIKNGIEGFKKQFIYARFHTEYGSPKIGLRILRRLKIILEKKKIKFPTMDLKRMVGALGALFYYHNTFKEIIDLKKIYPKQTIPESKALDRYFKRSYLMALAESQGPNQRIISELTHLMEENQDNISWLYVYLSLCNYQIQLGKTNYKDTAEDIKKRDILKLNIEKSLILNYLGLGELESKRPQKALSYFQTALKEASHPQDVYLTLTNLDLIESYQMPFEQKLFIKCWQAKHLIANAKSLNETRIHEYKITIQKLKKELKNKNVWYVEKESMNAFDYKKIEKTYPCLDLISGILFKSPDEKILLTPKRTSFLLCLIASGSLGASESKLIDEVYPEITTYNEHLKEALRNIALQLKKWGIKSFKKKDLYYYKFTQNPFSIIIPITLKSTGPNVYCKNLIPLFTADLLKKTLNLKTATAYLYIKDWQKDGLIKIKKKIGKTTYYIFT